jgi:hypothetical protein
MSDVGSPMSEVEDNLPDVILTQNDAEKNKIGFQLQSSELFVESKIPWKYAPEQELTIKVKPAPALL